MAKILDCPTNISDCLFLWIDRNFYAEKLKPILSRTNVLIFNRDEAEILTGKKEIPVIMTILRKFGIEVICITDGGNDLHAYHNNRILKLTPQKIKVVDMTGAGDAFSSTFVAAIIKGASVEAALLWAPINAMSVVQKVGAQAGLLNVHQIEQYLHTAPQTYHPQRLT